MYPTITEGSVKIKAKQLAQVNVMAPFLDEINSMDLQLQSKLLRVIEEKTVTRIGGDYAQKFDVRILAAINCSPEMFENLRTSSKVYSISPITASSIQAICPHAF